MIFNTTNTTTKAPTELGKGSPARIFELPGMAFDSTKAISMALGHSFGNRVTNIYINRNRKKSMRRIER